MTDPTLSALADLPWLQRLAVALASDADEADDLVQDTLIAAWRRPPADHAQPLRPWLATVLRNAFRMRRRSGERRAQREQSAARASGAPAADEELARLELLRSLVGELELLEPGDRRIVVRRFFHDESAADIARALAIPAATVRSRLHRSLHRLRARLDERQPRTSWCAVVLAVPTPTPKATPMSLTIKALLVSTAGAVGLAGWLAQPAAPKPASEPAEASQATSVDPPASPGARWEQRRRQIRRAPLPPVVARTAGPEEDEHDDFRELVRTCLTDLESDASGAVTIDVNQIGAPDIGTIYESVEIVETTVEDPELLQCLLQSMHAWVGAAPTESFERRSTWTFTLGQAATAERKRQDVFSAIVGAHINEVRYCEKRGDPDAPGVAGHLLLALTLAPRDDMSRPGAAEVRDTDLPTATVECVVTASKRWVFPGDFVGHTFEYDFTLPIAGPPPRGDD